MNLDDELDGPSHEALVRRHAAGTLSMGELRDAGCVSVVRVLSDLHRLGLRPPTAEMTGPNVETRRAGIARLNALMGASAPTAGDTPVEPSKTGDAKG